MLSAVKVSYHIIVVFKANLNYQIFSIVFLNVK